LVLHGSVHDWQGSLEGLPVMTTMAAAMAATSRSHSWVDPTMSVN